MASNYEVNIKLNTRTVNKQLNNLEKRISKLNKLAQGGKANRTVLRNEQEKIKKTGQRLGLENKILKRKQEQLKVDQQQLRVEQQTANAINKQRSGGGGGRAGGGNRLSGALSSGIISGAFPLLFGQGPLIGAAGALGGGVGSLVGGQMGGFAGGLLATSIATPLQQFGIEAGKLGQALDPATKNVEALTAALGVTGTEFEKQLATLKNLGDEEAAFEAARQKMINLVGSDGVDALTKFGQGMTDLGNNFARIMTLMKTSFAMFIENSGIGKFLVQGLERATILKQAEVQGQNIDSTEGKAIGNLIEMRNKLSKTGAAVAGISIKGRENLINTLLGQEKGSGIFGVVTREDEDRARELINDLIVKNQTLINDKNRQKEADEMIAKIQQSRVKNIDKEIQLLERSFNMTSEEFEIEKQIAEMKEQGAIKDEEALRNKLKDLQVLQKQRELADQTAAAFERMSQTIATDISQGIQGMIRGTSTLNDMLNNVLNKLIDAAFNMAFFGNPQGTLGGGGLFGSILGGLGSIFGGGGGMMGGGGYFDPITGLGTAGPNFGLANGGIARGRKTHLVGERGPELFTPGVTGTITPNHALGGSTNIVVNVDASGSNVEGDEEQGRELGRIISAAIQSELIKQKRPGGMLA
mgnify:FL=1